MPSLTRTPVSAPSDEPRVLSMFDPVQMGINEYGEPVGLPLMYRNILLGGEPGSGKSVALNTIVAHAALSPKVELWLADGKQVELGMWEPVATHFVTDSLDDAIELVENLRAQISQRYSYLRSCRKRKIGADDLLFDPILFAIDEVAFYSATTGDKKQQELFSTLLRDVVARGRAAGVIVAAATQRPSSDIIPTSLRDLFGYRLAFRCSTQGSSDVILGHSWAGQGYNAATIDPDARGVGFLLAEGGIPQRIKTPFLSDEQIEFLVRYTAWTRGHLDNTETGASESSVGEDQGLS